MRKVQRGHSSVEDFILDVALPLTPVMSKIWFERWSDSGLSCSETGGTTGAETDVARLVVPATAAFSTCASGGFMPHARHGGRGVCTFAVVGSKLDGTGFENVQIGHTQVAFLAGVVSGTGWWN